MSMNFRRKLPVPKEIKELYPLNDKIKNIKTERDAMIADVFTGKSDKFLLIIGPCSADNEDSVMDYTCFPDFRSRSRTRSLLSRESTPTSQEPPARATRE